MRVVGKIRGGAEPDEFARVEADPGRVAENGEQRHVAGDRADGGAVVRGDRIEMVRGAQAAGPRHVLHHDRGVAGNVAAEISRDQPRAEIVAAAGTIADDHIDGPAAIKIGDRLRTDRAGEEESRQHRDGDTREL